MKNDSKDSVNRPPKVAKEFRELAIDGGCIGSRDQMHESPHVLLREDNYPTRPERAQTML